MAIHLRRALANDSDEVPDHFEGVALKQNVKIVGWLSGVALAIGGVVVMVKGSGSPLEAVGAVFAAGGALILVGVVRCRRFEIQVGRDWLRIGSGPLTHRFKRDLICQFRQQAATGWRRLYSDREFELTLTVDEHKYAFPTLEPEELATALAHDGLTDSR